MYTEAYACGVPFVAVKGQGISEIVPGDGQEKWLIEKGDDNQLARLILSFIKDKPQQLLAIDVGIDSLLSSFLSFVNTSGKYDYSQ